MCYFSLYIINFNIGAVTLNNITLDASIDTTIARTNVQCTGMESRIIACPSSNDTKNCNHLQDAGVVCSEGNCT